MTDPMMPSWSLAVKMGWGGDTNEDMGNKRGQAQGEERDPLEKGDFLTLDS